MAAKPTAADQRGAVTAEPGAAAAERGAVTAEPGAAAAGASRVPTAAALFERYFVPQYRPDQLERRAENLARVDGLGERVFTPGPVAPQSPFDAPARDVILRQLDRMAEAARRDFAFHCVRDGWLDLGWVEGMEAWWDASRLEVLVHNAKPDVPSNDYVVLCCELGAALGFVLRQARPALEWLPELPYWESVLVDPATGRSFDVFRWAREHLSGAPPAGGLVARVRAAQVA